MYNMSRRLSIETNTYCKYLCTKANSKVHLQLTYTIRMIIFCILISSKRIEQLGRTFPLKLEVYKRRATTVLCSHLDTEMSPLLCDVSISVCDTALAFLRSKSSLKLDLTSSVSHSGISWDSSVQESTIRIEYNIKLFRHVQIKLLLII